MKWASSVSEEPSLDRAIEKCAIEVRAELGQDTPDLAIIFVSSHHSAEYDWVPDLVKRHLGPTLIFGCSAGGVIGGSREVEQRHGFSLTAASLPGVDCSLFHLTNDDLPDLDASPSAWEIALSIDSDSAPNFIILADPLTFHVPNLLLGLDYAFPHSVKIGGLASGGQGHGGNALYLGDKTYTFGAVGLALRGDVKIDTVVAQGCRPIGKTKRITECHQNLLTTIDDESPMKVLQELFDSADERDQGLMRTSLFLGIAMDEFEDNPEQGDFLIRNLIGMDTKSGSIAIGELLREGQVIQFHLRDALTSRDDLESVLVRYAANSKGRSAHAALLFSCLGRGQYLYGRANHDTDLFREKAGLIPVGGFFCNGEIGPVGGTTFLHGFTSSFGLFRPSKP